mgnify:CR=1 FL=1
MQTETQDEQPDTISLSSIDDDEIIVFMDGYNGDWTPTAAMTDTDQAETLYKLLTQDSRVTASITQMYASKQDVRNNETTPRPTPIPDEITVAFNGDVALAAATEDIVAREMQCQKGGYRGTVSVYETVEEAAANKPLVLARYIEAKNISPAELQQTLQTLTEENNTT